jgi:hypothetical protein
MPKTDVLAQDHQAPVDIMTTNTMICNACTDNIHTRKEEVLYLLSVAIKEHCSSSLVWSTSLLIMLVWVTSFIWTTKKIFFVNKKQKKWLYLPFIHFIGEMDCLVVKA